jgi:hypothetical protein
MPLWSLVLLLFAVTTLNAPFKGAFRGFTALEGPFQGARSALRATILPGDRYALGLLAAYQVAANAAFVMAAPDHRRKTRQSRPKGGYELYDPGHGRALLAVNPNQCSWSFPFSGTGSFRCSKDTFQPQSVRMAFPFDHDAGIRHIPF